VAAITIMNSENVSMWYYPESKILHHQMHKFICGQTFQDALTKGADAFQKYGAQKWLSDDRAIPALSKEDLEWGDTVWFPRISKLGWKYWAIVMPEKVIGQLMLKNLMDSYLKRGVTTRAFASVEEAQKWLELCQ
jgi:hypothetical protein